MKLPSWIYRSDRIGLHGKIFSVYKIRTLIPNADKLTQFATPEVYTRFGRFLRRTKLDEFLQIVNVLRGNMSLVGPRPDFQESYDIMPDYVKEKILSVKPGMTSLASIYFYDEEELLQKEGDKLKNYWTIIKPIKILLDCFYVENKCFLLDLVILWLTFKKVIKSFFK